LSKITADQVAFLEEVPPLELPFAEIASPKAGGYIEGIAVNSRVVQVYTHYVSGRTKPHLRDKSLCEGCQQARKRTYKAYMAVWLPGTSQYALMEITHYAAMAWSKFINDEKWSWRGARLKTIRLGRGPNGRCRLEVSWKAHDPVKLPDPIPIMEILLQIWAGETRKGKVPDRVTPHTLEEVPQ
jgi:hypothetical protein